MNNIKQEIKSRYTLSDNTIDYLLQVFNEVTIIYRLDSLQNLLDRPISDADVMSYIYKETVKRYEDEADKADITLNQVQQAIAEADESKLDKNNLTSQNQSESQQVSDLDLSVMRIEDTDEEKLEKTFSKFEKAFKTIFLYILLLLAVSIVSTLLSVNLKYTISITVLSILIYKFLMLLSDSNYKSVPISRNKYAGHKEV